MSYIVVHCQNCVPCAPINPKKVHVFTPWPKCVVPFESVHLDFCELQKIKSLIICDAFSKWIDVRVVDSHTSQEVVHILLTVLSNWGLPLLPVTDNELCFCSQLFKDFCVSFIIALLHSPEYHAPSSGQAERSVGICKAVLKKLYLDSSVMPVNQKLFKFLFTYRNTPSVVIGKSPFLSAEF